jgi:hypothetical protein
MVELINNEVLHVCNERKIAISRLFAKHKPREVTDCISIISYNLYALQVSKTDVGYFWGKSESAVDYDIKRVKDMMHIEKLKLETNLRKQNKREI